MKNIQLTSRTPVLIAVCALLTGTFALFSLQTQAADPKTAPSPKPALTVSVTQPEATTLIVKLSANGNIAAWQEASVGSEAPGLRLAEVRANVGDRVRAGQVLAVFAADAVQADLAQARASLLEAQATAAEAAQNADRARSLQNTGAMSAQQIGQFTTAEQTAKARVASAQAQLASQTLRLKNTQVLAPDAGIVSARSATVGAVPGGAELFRLIRQGRLEWRAEVTSAELARVKVGVVVNVVAANGVQTKGRVRMVAPTVDAQTRAALVYVDLVPAKGGAADVGHGAILAGMYARGEFELGQTSGLTLPQSAVVLRDGFSYVYRLGADNRVSQVKVQTGRLVGERYEITTGLAADARVVASGGGFLNDGDLVRVVALQGLKQAEVPVKPAQAANQ